MSEERCSETPLLDEWRAEVGDDAVAAAVEAAALSLAGERRTAVAAASADSR